MLHIIVKKLKLAKSLVRDTDCLSTESLAMYIGLVFLIFLYLSFLYYINSNANLQKRSLPSNWPIVGMLPGLLLYCHRIHDFMTEVLEESGGTFLFKGPWFSNMDMIITSDPANVHYILNKNSHNFHKGPNFEKIFDALGDGIFIAEAKHWEDQRKTATLLIKHPNFQKHSASICWEKIETRLIPILHTVAEMGTRIDLQELFKRLAFDCTCIQVLGHDPVSLKEDMPHLPYEKAFADAEEAVFLRHVFPETSWKLQEWFRIGKEHNLASGKKAVFEFMSSCISPKHNSWKNDQAKDDVDLITGFMRTFPGSSDMTPDAWKYIMLNFVFAGKDSISAALSWFFWLIATHPREEKKINQEIVAYSSVKNGQKWEFTTIDDLKKLTYLHGAICEALRLFPPVALNHKAPAEPDTLPSGHKIKPNTKTILSFYSMGRNKSIWGKDCLEFKPERWISDTGHIIHIPSFKFPAFNGGPRSCLGKEISFIQMKIVAAAIINRFQIEVADGLLAEPNLSVILHMKHGLKVKVSHRV